MDKFSARTQCPLPPGIHGSWDWPLSWHLPDCYMPWFNLHRSHSTVSTLTWEPSLFIFITIAPSKMLNGSLLNECWENNTWDVEQCHGFVSSMEKKHLRTANSTVLLFYMLDKFVYHKTKETALFTWLGSFTITTCYFYHFHDIRLILIFLGNFSPWNSGCTHGNSPHYLVGVSNPHLQLVLTVNCSQLAFSLGNCPWHL